MKKIIYFFAIVFTFIWAGTVVAAERIDSYDVSLKLNEDSSIEIVEKIEYNFESIQKHGIFRDIPYKYRARGGNFSLKISDISVTDESGEGYQYDINRSGGEVHIKIGNPNSYVSGKKTYIIKYQVDGAVNYFEDFDEIYWNAIGTDWDVSINNPSAKLFLPKNFDSNALNISCYVGIEGGKQQCQYFISKDRDEISFSINSLNPREGLTFAVGFPKSVVYEPTKGEIIWRIIRDNWVVLVPFVVFFSMLYLWWTKGRDPKGRGTVVAQFESPNNLTPLEIGIILDERSDSGDISAQIIHLAIKGYLRIEKIENKILFFSHKDYKLIKLKNSDSFLASFERSLMDGLFGGKSEVKLSDLKKKFYKDVEKINKKAYKKLVSEGYFKKNPNLIRKIYTSIGTGLLVLGIFLGTLILGEIGGGIIFLSGIIVIVFGNIMPAKTKKGVLAKEHILGLKRYLSVAEKDRLEFHNGPEKNPQQFEKLLPFAMALSVEKEWAIQFEGIYTRSPEWYSASMGTGFSPTSFASDMKSFAAATAASGGTGSSGGGSAGGGGGGGGGGSW